MGKVISKINIHELASGTFTEAKLFVIIVALIEKLGGEATLGIEELEHVFQQKELVLIRNDEDDEEEPSVTLKVEGYTTSEVN